MSIARRLFNAFKRRMAGARISEFKANIASPFALGSKTAGQSFNVYTMPGPGRIAVRSSVNQTAGKVTINTVALPALTAGAWLEWVWLEESEPLTVALVSGVAAGTLSIAILDDWERPLVIATGTMT